jgi:hypothetical protein
MIPKGVVLFVSIGISAGATFIAGIAAIAFWVWVALKDNSRYRNAMNRQCLLGHHNLRVLSILDKL